MELNDLLRAGANVSVTVSLEDLKQLFKEVAGAFRPLKPFPPPRNIDPAKRYCSGWVSTRPPCETESERDISIPILSAAANAICEATWKRSARAGNPVAGERNNPRTVTTPSKIHSKCYALLFATRSRRQEDYSFIKT